MGGLVGQDLAAARPDLVDRLVVAVAGRRLAAPGEGVVRTLREYATDRVWRKIVARLSYEMHTGVRRAVYPGVARAVGLVRPPQPAEPRDVPVSIDAILEYDAVNRLGDVEPPTLVGGGSEDVFFPEGILRETQDRIPEARLAVFHGARYGAYREHKEQFDDVVSRFLAEEPLRGALPG